MVRNRWLLLPLMLALAAALSYVVLSLPEHADGLQKIVTEKIGGSGVSNPVTAVLLNFRGYDSLLEMVVLLLALLGSWSLGGPPLPIAPPTGLVLGTLARQLSPVLILVAAYLLWVGGHAPGGAFQGGAVLGAAGVLLLLAGWQLHPGLAQLPLRLMLTVGPAVFVVIAALMLFRGGRLLEYPPAQADTLILIIEIGATISIGVTLAALFQGAPPEQKEKQ